MGVAALVKLYAMSLGHMLIWLFVTFGGLWKREIVVLNTLVLLPIIYAVQTVFPAHVIIERKIRDISSEGDWGPVKPHVFTRWEVEDVRHLADVTGLEEAEVARCYEILKSHESNLVVPAVLDAVARSTERSYRCPVDALGLIVIAYIVNCALFATLYRT